MVKLLAELHGGAVAVESAVGRGLVLHGLAAAPGGGRRAHAAGGDRRRRGASRPAGGAHALVVEDDFKSAELIRVQLEAEGFTVLHAASAEAALVLAAQQPLSLITPRTSCCPTWTAGSSSAASSRCRSCGASPVVIISIVADRNKGFALGAAAVMQKPISRQELYESLVELGLFPSAKGRALKVLVVDDDPKAVELIAVRIVGWRAPCCAPTAAARRSRSRGGSCPT